MAYQANFAKKKIDQLRQAQVWGPLIAGILGVAALIIGFLLLRHRSGRAAAGSHRADDGASGPAGEDHRDYPDHPDHEEHLDDLDRSDQRDGSARSTAADGGATRYGEPPYAGSSQT